jgi:glycopeptide antibiotics resistance protein
VTPPSPILSRRHYALLTLAFGIFVVYGSLVPLEFRAKPFDEAVAQYAKVMSKPLDFTSRSDWAANVLLFIPFGFFAMGAANADSAQGRGRRGISGVAILILTAIFSGAIEFSQLWFPPRNTAINDVVANVLGCGLGLLGWILTGELLTKRVRDSWNSVGPDGSSAKILPFYLAFVVVVNGLPFDLSISPTELAHKYKHGLLAIAPTREKFVDKLPVNIAYFAPFGLLLARLPGARWRHNPGRVFGVSLLIAGIVEGVQLLVLSCGTYASDIVIGAVVSFVAWWLATRPQPLKGGRWLAVAAWVALLVGLAWRKYDYIGDGRLHWKLEEIFWVPFTDYYRSYYLSSFEKIIDKLMVFGLFGYLLAGRGGRLRGGVWLVALAGGLLSGLIEGGYLFLAAPPQSDEFAMNPFAPIPSTSKFVLGFLGGGLGALFASRSPREVPGEVPGENTLTAEPVPNPAARFTY